jgi:hypothetical protein
MRWFRLDPASGLAVVHAMSDADAGRWVKQLFCDLISEDPDVAESFARAMIVERNGYVSERAKAGKLGAEARWQPNGKAMGEPCVRMAITTRNETRRDGDSCRNGSEGNNQKLSLLEKPSERFGDKYQEIESIPASGLAKWTADYCGDADRKRAATGYGNALRLIGEASYRTALTMFVGSLAAGEEPVNRGATFNKRYLRPCVDALKSKQKAVAP